MDSKYILGTKKFVREDGTEFAVNLVRPGGCQVFLIDTMQDPEQLIAKLSRGYEGIYEPTDVPIEDVKRYFSDQMKTKLHGPMEMVFMVFLVNNVSRAMTHQFVRTRLASFVQESMRFLGQKNEYNVLMSTRLGVRAREIYMRSVTSSVKDYEDLLELGTSSEDARGALPTNIMTSLFVGLPLNSLQHIYEQRMCCQAQPGEWQPMLTKMKEAIKTDLGDNVASLLSAPYERGEACGYQASYDRPCVWRKNEQK